MLYNIANIQALNLHNFANTWKILIKYKKYNIFSTHMKRFTGQTFRPPTFVFDWLGM